VDPQLHEIVDLAQVDGFMVHLAIVVLVVGLLIGVVMGAVRGRALQGLGRGLAFGILGPIVLIMWRFYRYMVRYDPETGHVGLHKMSVFVVNVLIFAAVGVLLGMAYGRLLRGAKPPPAENEQQESAGSVGS